MTSSNLGLGLVFFGGPGLGKTTLATYFPKPLDFFSVKETGYIEQAPIGTFPTEGINHIQCEDYDILKYKIETSQAKTKVVDSISGLSQVMQTDVVDKVYDGKRKSFDAYQQGVKQDCPVWMQEFLDSCNKARANESHVVLLGHRYLVKEKNPAGADMLKHTIALDDADKEGMRAVLIKWAQAIIYLTLDLTLERAVTTDKENKTTVGKVKDVDLRLMYTGVSTVHDAKNRLNLPDPILCGDSAEQAFNNFWNKLPEFYRNMK